ncbi:hypothetical protein [uncultured Pontibacter sp.]|uniref:hypothetical protein n=1 Tax=uncultured Pontibacter sp. TaxID=453356 RepID=UPI00261B943D|nr:hypothetical protein [uncultured Pontibacter sp.]
MQIFSNGFFQIEYDIFTDTVSVSLPDMRTAELSEAKLCFEILVDHVRNYHVENLLLDSSKAVVEVGNAAYNKLIYQVSMSLKETRLKKVARLVSGNAKLEEMATQVQGEVLGIGSASYQIRNFTSKGPALEWLTGKPPLPA